MGAASVENAVISRGESRAEVPETPVEGEA